MNTLIALALSLGIAAGTIQPNWNGRKVHNTNTPKTSITVEHKVKDHNNNNTNNTNTNNTQQATNENQVVCTYIAPVYGQEAHEWNVNGQTTYTSDGAPPAAGCTVIIAPEPPTE